MVDNRRVDFRGEDHVIIDGKSYVSLRRFRESISNIDTEIKELIDRNKELAEENNAFRILLKDNI